MQKGITFNVGHAFLQRHKAAARLPCAAAACAGKGVSRQCGNSAGSIRFSAKYYLGKLQTLVKTMQITVEQERGTLTRMPDDGAINNRARSCSFGARRGFWGMGICGIFCRFPASVQPSPCSFISAGSEAVGTINPHLLTYLLKPQGGPLL